MGVRKYLWLIFLLGISGVASSGELKKSLCTKFSDVILSGMAPGMVYSLKKEKNFPYKVQNNTDHAEDVEVVIEKPSSSQLKKGYEPVLDITWVKVFPVKFHLKAGESTNCDVIIAIPDEEKYTNRHFQAMLVTRTIANPEPGVVGISFALANRIRFSTGPRPETIMAEYRQRVMEVLKIDLAPFSLFVDEVRLEKRLI